MKRFFKLPKLALGILLILTMSAAACTASQITAYINLLSQLAVDALTITSDIQGTAISQGDAALVTQWQALLQSDVSAFQADKSAGDSTLVALASTTENGLPAFLQTANFANSALQTRIVDATDVFVTGIESIAAIASSSSTPVPAPAVSSVKVGNSGIVYRLPSRVKTPQATIVANWNTKVCQTNPSCKAHAVHVSSEFVRIVTIGHVK